MKERVRNWLSQQVGDDEELLKTLYEDYRRVVAEQLAQSQRDIAAGDAAALDRTAHALKGVVLTVGDQDMLPRVLELRDAAKASDMDAARAAVAQIAAQQAEL